MILKMLSFISMSGISKNNKSRWNEKQTNLSFFSYTLFIHECHIAVQFGALNRPMFTSKTWPDRKTCSDCCLFYFGVHSIDRSLSTGATTMFPPSMIMSRSHICFNQGMPIFKRVDKHLTTTWSFISFRICAKCDNISDADN